MSIRHMKQIPDQTTERPHSTLCMYLVFDVEVSADF